MATTKGYADAYLEPELRGTYVRDPCGVPLGTVVAVEGTNLIVKMTEEGMDFLKRMKSQTFSMSAVLRDPSA